MVYCKERLELVSQLVGSWTGQLKLMSDLG